MEDFKIAEEFIIEDLETLKILTDPLRVRILRSLGHKARSVKETAERLDMPQAKLYYHINLMEKHGLIQVVDTRVVSGIIEKLYAVTARMYRPGAGLLTAVDPAPVAEETKNMATMVTGIMEAAREDLQNSLRKGTATFRQTSQPSQQFEIAYQTLHLTDEEILAFQEEFRALLARTGGKTPTFQPNERTYNLFYLYFVSDENNE